ncbi:MAG: type III pantothenate kinase [Bacteroidetes bacterium]|nr:type III pantothenate kinase [Bacteroidota bacterium]MBS1739203.1 type III pantothenate kinase [Bacteroidota bacterium]MBS1775652.1 type III pantothenate kinase [Bacteroidota bacterium]
MNKTLCIDWGNSLVKAAIFEADKIIHHEQLDPNAALSTLVGLIEIHQPQGAILSSVVSNMADVQMHVREKVAHFLKLDMNTFLPIMNAYSSPETLGVDRLAIAVGAQAAFSDKNVLAISLGTCITYNFVQKNKAFRGGAISPGLHMRLKSMHEWTDRLPEVKPDGEVLLLGYDTETCMRSGAVFGMASEIDGMVTAFADQYPDFNAVLTGGDSAMFVNKLKSKIFADPDLLMKGLNLILLHNVPQLR